MTILCRKRLFFLLMIPCQNLQTVRQAGLFLSLGHVGTN